MDTILVKVDYLLVLEGRLDAWDEEIVSLQ